MIDSDLLHKPLPVPGDVPAAPFYLLERSSRLRRRLAFAVLACLAILLVGYLSLQWSRRADLAALHEGSTRRLAVLNAALFAPIDKFSYLPDVVLTHPLLTQLLDNPADPALVLQANQLLKGINHSARSAVIYVLDPRGIVLASSNWQEGESFVGKDYSFRPYFRDAMAVGTGRFYGMGTTSLLPGYYLSSAIRRAGATLGVVVVKIDMTSFDGAWKTKDEAVVSDANGVIILSSRNDWRYRPLRPLSEAARAQLARTRQYENVLKPALLTTVADDLGSGEQILRIAQPTPLGGSEDAALYFSKNARLAGSDWTLQVLTPIDEIDAHARGVAFLSAAALAFMLLLYLYVDQVRGNMRERENARLALQTAHGSLEEQHRRLQTISEELRVKSTTDPLTGAYNRRYFFEAVDQLLSAHRRTDGVLSLVMIDIDHFKAINDRHGHPAGDVVLQTLTALAQGLLRDADLFARFGGEEFIIALPNAAGPEALAAAERLRERVLATRFEYAGMPIEVRISCGVAQHRNDDESLAETIRRADAALYQAKADGRNQVCVG